MHTINQQYAVDAYKKVTAVPKEDRDKYATMAHKLPILIRTSGLMQAVAFVDAKGKGEPVWQRYLNDVAQTINYRDGKALLTASRCAGISEYILLTHRVSAALLWYKRFAESVFDDGQEEFQKNEAEEATS